MTAESTNLSLGFLWASVWCATSPAQTCLLFSFCSSVQMFAVSLTSVHELLHTTLRLAKTLERYLHV